MNPTLIAVLLSLVIGIALAVPLYVYAPQSVRASDALTRLGEAAVVTSPRSASLSRWERIGSWTAHHMPQVRYLGAPTRDLDLLEIPVSRFYASKIKSALFGFFVPLIFAGLIQLLTGQPFLMPLALAPLLALVMWTTVDSQVRAKAAAARREFTRFISVYLQLVAVALLGNTTADSALNDAASLSDSWVFQRIRREYAAADLTRTSKWDAIESLGTQLDIPAMGELGRTMRLSEARVGLRDQLIASADKLRDLAAADDLAAAEKVTRNASYPVYATLLPLILLLMIPPIFSLTSL